MAGIQGRIPARPRRTANRPGSQRMARYKITDFLQSERADMLRTGTVRGPGAVSRCAPNPRVCVSAFWESGIRI